MWNHFFYERKCIMKPLRNQRQHVFVTALAMALCLVCAGPAAAQIGFEPDDYQGSADGVILTGQQGWYIPGVGGDDFFVFTYDSNALQFPANAYGDTQFIGSTALGDNTFPRAQWDYDWNQASVWTVSYDLCGHWAGSGAGIDNLSSFSLQDSTVARSFTAVNTWVPMTSDSWRANYQIYNAAGQLIGAYQLPGPEWDNLQVDHWYNQSVTFDFDQNLIVSVSITDLDSGGTATVSPDSWYLQGGANPTQPLPTALRFFVGGGAGQVIGNVMGFDNLVISPAGNNPIGGPKTKSISVPTDRSAVID
jgi:hypothetical protein